MVNGKLCLDVDVTSDFLKNEEDYTDLFDWLNRQKSIKQDSFFKCPLFGLKKKDITNYRWNYVENKTYPGNETRALILGRLEKQG